MRHTLTLLVQLRCMCMALALCLPNLVCGQNHYDTTQWANGLPYGYMQGVMIPGQSLDEGNVLTLTFIPTDTAAVTPDGKWVTFNGYYISTTEVTQRVWEIVMGPREWNQKGDNLPATGVNLWDVMLFLERLDSLIGGNPRIPTVQEWEFASRGGHLSENYRYSGSDNPNFVAWWQANSLVKTGKKKSYMLHPVGRLLENEAMLYDMHGNAAEMAFANNGNLVAMGGCSASNEDEMIRPCPIFFPTVTVEPEAGAIHSDFCGFRIVMTARRDYIDPTKVN